MQCANEHLFQKLELDLMIYQRALPKKRLGESGGEKRKSDILSVSKTTADENFFLTF
jgi:Fe-S cluster assembly ATPase SufC